MKLLTILLTTCAIFFLTGCASPIKDSSSALEPGVEMELYKYVTIYDSESASFIEQALQNLFRKVGFSIIGEKEAVNHKPGTVLGVRYTEGIRGQVCKLTVLLEDFTTDLTVLTVQGRGRSFDLISGPRADCEEAWNQLEEKLKSVLSR